MLKNKQNQNWHGACNVSGMEAKGAIQPNIERKYTMSNSNAATQAFAFALALIVSVAGFGVTVAPDHSNDVAPVSAELIA